MSIIKTYLCSKMEDDWMNHLMIYYTERRYLEALAMTKSYFSVSSAPLIYETLYIYIVLWPVLVQPPLF